MNQSAKPAVMSAHPRDNPTSRWLVQLKEPVGWQKARVPKPGERMGLAGRVKPKA